MRTSSMKILAATCSCLLFASLVDGGCPFFDMQQQQDGNNNDEDGIRRMLRGLLEGISGHPPVSSNSSSACDPTMQSCYGRLFPDLDSFEADWLDLLQMGLPMKDTDGSPAYMLEDFFGLGRARTGEVSRNSGNSWPNFSHRPGVGAAGYTYLGQLFSHDVNKDTQTQLGHFVDANDVSSHVTAAADLDTMYGHMTQGKFVMTEVRREVDGEPDVVVGHDYVRTSIDGNEAVAQIFDARNDNTMVIAQIQILFQQYHNRVYDYFNTTTGQCNSTTSCFDMAREETIKTWQSIIAHDLLPHLISTEVYNFMNSSSGGLAGYQSLFYKPGTKSYDEQRTPAEFSTCAYRVLHSRVAPAYLWGPPAAERGNILTFGASKRTLVGGRAVLPDLLPMPWQLWFDLGGDFEPAPTGHLLDPLYVDSLIKSPLGVPGNPSSTIELRCDEEQCQNDCDGESCLIVDHTVDSDIVDPNWGETASLASIDFLRGQTFQLPGGFAMQALANEILNTTNTSQYPRIFNLTMDIIKNSQLQPFGLPAAWEETNVEGDQKYNDIPCMLYMFMESVLHDDEVGGGASRLGPLGSYIVGEAVVGFIRHAEINIFDNPNFTSLASGSHEVTMKDLIDFVGATPNL